MHASIRDAVGGTMALVQSSPAMWSSALLSNALIFLIGSPILVAGLSLSGIVPAFLLGTFTWRAFGPAGFLFVVTYFVILAIEGGTTVMVRRVVVVARVPLQGESTSD
ncbi:hypothetical protein Fmac_007647 [Flemingia macrophylla]|uniref:Integral membrane protein n=1 Tax=Flemingia macrophylla TaxID=520843 RepID=A0ABD1MW05_9FABA